MAAWEEDTHKAQKYSTLLIKSLQETKFGFQTKPDISP